MSRQIESELTALLLASAGALGLQPADISTGPILDIPKDPGHGDITTNLAMQLAQRQKGNATQFAQRLADELKRQCTKHKRLCAAVGTIEVAGGGFINITLTPRYLIEVLCDVLLRKHEYGRSLIGKGRRISVEFVSANPTGPLTIAHGRQAAFGAALVNILSFTGFRAHSEYYLNDTGRQMLLLAESLRARYCQHWGMDTPLPEDGYRGQYLKTLAEEAARRYGRRWLKDPERSRRFFLKFGTDSILALIKKDLDDFGVRFDSWIRESWLRRSGRVNRALSFLKEKGYTYQQDGALFFRSTQFGDDKDRVLVKSDGELTYIAPDIAYHYLKFQRGFDEVVDIWGPDHHGYIRRLQASVEALGFSRKRLRIIIAQLVTLFRGTTPLSMSTRMGEFVTLRELVGEVGRDAARFFFLMRRADSHLPFDLELAKARNNDNPVYYLQYAHARISSILRFSKIAPQALPQEELCRLLHEPEELELLRIIREFPVAVEQIAGTFEPYRLIPYLTKLAQAFHSFYQKHRVVSDNLALTRSRLLVCVAVKTVLANALRLLGISAPETM